MVGTNKDLILDCMRSKIEANEKKICELNETIDSIEKDNKKIKEEITKLVNGIN